MVHHGLPPLAHDDIVPPQCFLRPDNEAEPTGPARCSLGGKVEVDRVVLIFGGPWELQLGR
eukprot:12893133-Prorocentrum_lima.AAC.1